MWRASGESEPGAARPQRAAELPLPEPAPHRPLLARHSSFLGLFSNLGAKRPPALGLRPAGGLREPKLPAAALPLQRSKAAVPPRGWPLSSIAAFRAIQLSLGQSEDSAGPDLLAAQERACQEAMLVLPWLLTITGATVQMQRPLWLFRKLQARLTSSRKA